MTTQSLLNINDFILEKNLMDVKNVGKPSGFKQNLLDITHFILVKNPINVKNAGRPLALIQN